MTTYTIDTTVYTSKVYRQCLGTAWHGSGQCSTCGNQIGTGGNCLALIEIVPITEKEDD